MLVRWWRGKAHLNSRSDPCGTSRPIDGSISLLAILVLAIGKRTAVVGSWHRLLVLSAGSASLALRGASLPRKTLQLGRVFGSLERADAGMARTSLLDWLTTFPNRPASERRRQTELGGAL